MAKIKQGAWAGVDMKAKPPHIMAWSIRGNPNAVRREIGLGWTEKKDADAGWKQAMADGIRVKKIEMIVTL